IMAKFMNPNKIITSVILPPRVVLTAALPPRNTSTATSSRKYKLILSNDD
ncbi:20915_t:CDS:1, partial [Dentiscutata erythropus]